LEAKIFSNTILIGTAQLYITDESMGIISGEFLPAENYYSFVQKAVWEHFFSAKPCYDQWLSLNINAQLSNGYFLYAAGGYDFEDSPDFPDESFYINIAGVDRHVLEDFFLEPEPRPFVVEPWESIDIGQKFAFEDELRKEIGLQSSNNSFLSFVKPSKNEHILTDFEFSALCHRGGNDDVLFKIIKRGFDKSFAIVHLTWVDRDENSNYPKVSFYSDFDDFKYSRMYPDKAEWEY